MEGRTGLRTRLLLVIAAVFVSMAAVAAYLAHLRRADSVAAAFDRLHASAVLIAREQGTIIRSTEQFVAGMVEARNLAVFAGDARCPGLLAEELRREPRLANIAIVLADGRIRCSALPADTGSAVTASSYFRQALTSRVPVLGTPTVNPVTRTARLPVVSAFFGAGGSPQGAFIATLNLDWLGRHLAAGQFGPDARMGLIAADGLVLARYPDRERVVGQSRANTRFFRDLVRAGGRGAIVSVGWDGIRRIYALEPFAETAEGSITLWIGVSQQSVLGPINQLFAWTVGLAALVCILLGVGLWLGVERMLLVPIRSLEAASRAAAAGDYGVRASEAGPAELVVVSREFNKMLAAQSGHARSLLEASLDPLVTISPEGTITDVNEATVEATGVPRAELIGTDFSSYFTEPDRARAGYQRVFAEGSVRNYPLTIRHRGGRLTAVLYNASVYRDVSGAVAGVFAAARDVSEVARLSRALRTLSRCNEGIARASGEQDLLDRVCRILVDEGGYRLCWVGWAVDDPEKHVAPAAWAGESADYVTAVDARWDDTERGQGPTGRAIRERRTQIERQIDADPAFAPWREGALAHGYAASIAAPLLRGDRVLGALMLYSEDPESFDAPEQALVEELAENISFGVGALRDAAERSAALVRERERLNNVLEALPVYAVLLSRDYHVPFANRYFRERFGEARGRRCYEYLFGRSEPCVVCESFVPFTTHAPHRWSWVGPDGRNYEIDDHPFTDADGSECILEMGIDVTEQRRAEQRMRDLNVELEQRVMERTTQLESANEELEAFAYSVSHDLRAPLRSMNGFSQALVEDYGPQLDAQGKDYVARVQAATVRMGQLIDDLLLLSRVGRAEMRREDVDVTRLAHVVGQALLRDAPERHGELIVAENLTARADPALLRLVMENLLGNAWKFTSKHPRARIEVGRANTDRGSAFFVKDDGAGFDPAYAEKLFGAFQRLHSSAEFEGTGIGLATVQRIIHRHGGQVWAESAVEQGATFYFTLE